MTGLKVTHQTEKMEWWILSSFLYSAVAAKVCWNIDPPKDNNTCMSPHPVSDRLAKTLKFSQSMPPFESGLDHFLG